MNRGQDKADNLKSSLKLTPSRPQELDYHAGVKLVIAHDPTLSPSETKNKNDLLIWKNVA